MIIAPVDTYSGFYFPLVLGQILCERKKLMILPKFLVEKMTPKKSGIFFSWNYMQINYA